MLAAQSSAVMRWIVLIAVWCIHFNVISALVVGAVRNLRIQRSGIDTSWKLCIPRTRTSYRQLHRTKVVTVCLDRLNDVNCGIDATGKKNSNEPHWALDEQPRVVGPGVGGEEPVSLAWFIHAFNFAVFNPQTTVLLVLSNLAVILCGMQL